MEKEIYLREMEQKSQLDILTRKKIDFGSDLIGCYLIIKFIISYHILYKNIVIKNHQFTMAEIKKP